MDLSAILRAVPDADPAFVELLQRAPEPPPEDRDRLLRALPELHRFFLEKRNILASGTLKDWSHLLLEEQRMIANYEAV